MVVINGENADVAGTTILQYLTDEEYNIKTIAVELNEEIISKTYFANIVLKDGDVMEIVHFMGGG